MAPSQQALVPRSGTTLETVQEVLGTLAARYRKDEVLTSVRQIPAREAEFRPVPAWVRSELSGAYRTKGIKELYNPVPPVIAPNQRACPVASIPTRTLTPR